MANKPSAFVESIYRQALAAGLSDAAARVMAAQGGIESSYGDRAPGFNYFGITKGPDWNGATVSRADKDAKGNPITQEFRAYTSSAAGIADRIAYMDVHFPGFNDAPTVPAALDTLQHGTFGKYYQAPKADYEKAVTGIIKKYAPEPVAAAAPAKLIPPVDIPLAGNLRIVDVTKGGAVNGGNMPANPFADRLRTGSIEGVIFHHSGGSGLVGAMTAGQGHGPQHGTSAQFYIDTDGTIYRYAPDSTAAIDIREPGDKFRTDVGQPTYVLGNQNSIGVEIIGTDSSKFTPAQKQAAAALAGELQATYHFPSSMIVGHGDIQGGPGGNKVPDEGVEVAAYARSRLATDGLEAIDAISPRDQATIALGYTADKPPLERLAAMTSGVTARQALYASAAAGVRFDPGAAKYDFGAITEEMPAVAFRFPAGGLDVAGNNIEALLGPRATADDIGPGPSSWFGGNDVAPGGVGSIGFAASGAVFNGIDRDAPGSPAVHPGNVQAGYAAPKSGTPATGFDTVLDPRQEAKFQQWKATVAPGDSGQDYDFRGAFVAGINPDPKTGHWPDTFKKPSEPTFSVESQYAKFAPALAGRWDGDTFVPPALSLEDRDALFAARVVGAAPVKPASPVGATVSSDRPLTAQDVHQAAAAQIIHIGKHDYRVGDKFDQGGFHYVVTPKGIQKSRIPTGEKTVVSGIVKSIATDAAEKAAPVIGRTLSDAGQTLGTGAGELHDQLNAGTATVTNALAGGVVSVGNFFQSFAPKPAAPSWQVAIQRALTPVGNHASPPVAISPATVAPKYAPVATPPDIPKSLQQTPVVISAAETRSEQHRRAEPITTSGSTVDPRSGDIPETKTHAPQPIPTYTSPIKAVPSTKPTTRIETHDAPNPDYAAWVKNQSVSSAVAGKLQDIHDRNDDAIVTAQQSAGPAPPQTIRISRAVPVGGGSLDPVRVANVRPSGGAAGLPESVAGGVGLDRVVKNGEIVVQPRASTIPTGQNTRNGSGAQAAQAAVAQSVKIASGKTVNVGAMGTSDGGKYVYQVQSDGSVKELKSGRTTASPTGPVGVAAIANAWG